MASEGLTLEETYPHIPCCLFRVIETRVLKASVYD